ncbi:MAG: hypothetical protein GY943_14375, partial [Chloroflexi bacterium]|nr:hypothetical protein [Chloroflexota bacterium]
MMGLLMLMVVMLAACQSETVLPTEVPIAAIDRTVEAAVAETVAAQSGDVEIAGEGEPPVTWTPIPQTNENTPVPDSTQPAPATSSPMPTVTAGPTDTPYIPTNTPRPTETAVSPTNTPAPAQPQPTSPPAAPTTPPNPVYGANIIVNGSFEDGWYNQWGIPELQLPNGWVLEYDEGATGFGSEAWDIYVRPETRVLPDYQLPAGERTLFIRHGVYTIKMFKGNGAISFRMFQEIALEAGTYTFEVNIYPDLVVDYQNGTKVYATDATSGEIYFIAPDGGTGWFFPAFGTWNTLSHTFTITSAQTVRVGVGVRGRYAIS